MNRLFVFAVGCLAVTILAGFLTAIATVVDTPFVDFRHLNSSHTLFALGFVIAGALGAAQTAVGRPPGRPQVVLFVIAIGAPFLAMAAGGFSGREYITWPPLFSIPLFVAISWAAMNILRGLGRLGGAQPEAAWLVGIGAILLLLGFAEAHLYLLPAIGLDIGKDMAVQWQGLDTLIGGWNAILYGVGAMIVAPAGQPSRWLRNLLLVAAVSGLLLTFSHHHYQSPQATWLKQVAFLSSLFAAVVFVHDFRTWRREVGATTKLAVLLLKAEHWTLFSVGTGFLMALPMLNVLMHGTYVVVAHAMGSMIGVNAMLIFAIARAQGGTADTLADARFRRWSRLFDWSLGGFVATLAGAGLAKGVLRPDGGYWAFIDAVQAILLLLPAFGAALGGLLLWIAVDSLRAGEVPGTVASSLPKTSA